MAAAFSRVFGGCRTLTAKAATNAAAAAGSGAGKEGKGILKTVPVSQTLANFAGESELSRATAVKKVWEHIKGNNLQVQFSRSFFLNFSIVYALREIAFSETLEWVENSTCRALTSHLSNFYVEII